MPTLEPEYVAEEVVAGILANEMMIVLPNIMTYLLLFKWWVRQATSALLTKQFNVTFCCISVWYHQKCAGRWYTTSLKSHKLWWCSEVASREKRRTIVIIIQLIIKVYVRNKIIQNLNMILQNILSLQKQDLTSCNSMHVSNFLYKSLFHVKLQLKTFSCKTSTKIWDWKLHLTLFFI